MTISYVLVLYSRRTLLHGVKSHTKSIAYIHFQPSLSVLGIQKSD